MPLSSSSLSPLLFFAYTSSVYNLGACFYASCALSMCNTCRRVMGLLCTISFWIPPAVLFIPSVFGHSSLHVKSCSWGYLFASPEQTPTVTAYACSTIQHFLQVVRFHNISHSISQDVLNASHVEGMLLDIFDRPCLCTMLRR